VRSSMRKRTLPGRERPATINAEFRLCRTQARGSLVGERLINLHVDGMQIRKQTRVDRMMWRREEVVKIEPSPYCTDS